MNSNNEMNKKKMLVIDAVFAAILLAIDQYTKYLAITILKGNPAHVLIDGVLELQYLENRGSAFGILQNQKVLLVTVGVVFMAVILYFLFKIPAEKKYRILHILFAAIIAGGLGNMIDRVRFDYVVDFISFVLIDYPIFNVADCYIVVATIGLFIVVMFVFKDNDLEFLSFKRKKTEQTGTEKTAAEKMLAEKQ